MAKLQIAMECGCFKRSGYDAQMELGSREEAIAKANEMIEDMNESFCGMHHFFLDDSTEDVVIKIEKA